MRDVKKELILELTELENKLDNLESFLLNENVVDIVGEDQYDLLVRQCIVMNDYSDILDERIELL